MFVQLAKLMSEKAAPILLNLVGADNFIGIFIGNHPVIATVLFMAIPAILLLLIALFFDFAADSWKMPFGIAADALAFYAFLHPGLLAIAAIAFSVIIIIVLLHELSVLKWIFAALSAGEIALTFLPGVPATVAAVAGIFCLNTVLFFIGCIID